MTGAARSPRRSCNWEGVLRGTTVARRGRLGEDLKRKRPSGRSHFGVVVPVRKTVPTDGSYPALFPVRPWTHSKTCHTPQDVCRLSEGRRFRLFTPPIERRKSDGTHGHDACHPRPRRRAGCPQDGDHRDGAPGSSRHRRGGSHRAVQRIGGAGGVAAEPAGQCRTDGKD